MTAAQLPTVRSAARGRTEGDSAVYTVEQLSNVVGMSPRNIRAHQARKLLAAPTRRGRVAMYDDTHVRRLEAILALQRQGFNLVSIEAILGPRSADPGMQALTQVVERLAGDRPWLVYALSRHDVVSRGEQGAVVVSRPAAVRAALGMHRVGVPAAPAVQLLGELLDSLRDVAAELVRCTSARTFALRSPGRRPLRPRTSWDELDRDTLAVSDGVVALLVEAFRVAVDNSARDIVAELVAERSGPELAVDVVDGMDSG